MQPGGCWSQNGDVEAFNYLALEAAQLLPRDKGLGRIARPARNSTKIRANAHATHSREARQHLAPFLKIPESGAAYLPGLDRAPFPAVPG